MNPTPGQESDAGDSGVALRQDGVDVERLEAEGAPSRRCATRATMSSMDPVNLEEKLASFTGYWQPRSVGQFNGHDLLLAKALGEFVWHKHDDTDDFFLVVKGTLVIEMRDRHVTLRSGELFVVPKGVEHRPVAREEVHVLVIEPLGTANTGDAATATPVRPI